MATISSLGVGSGLDAESIVTKLVALEKQPLAKLQAQATFDQGKITAFGQVQSQFSALGDAATTISQASAWKGVRASSSNTSAVTITATSAAAAQSFSLDVDRLAQKQSLTSAALSSSAFVGAGTLTFRVGSWSNTAGGASAAATLAAANAALTAAQNTLTTATADKTTKDAALATANQDLADADAALVAPTATRDAALAAYNAANSGYQTSQADVNAKQSIYNTALASYNSANTAATSATSALATADATLSSATTASANANTALSASVTTLSAATAASTAANSAFNIADSALAAANTTLATANSTQASAASASASANASRDSALSAYGTAQSDLNSYASSYSGGDPNVASYASAYSDWVDAQSTLAGSYTQSNLNALAAKKTALDNARTALTGSSPSQMSAIDSLTGSADATDAPALIVAANSAQATLTSANAAVTTATTAQATATTNRTNALTASQTAATDLVNAQDAHSSAYATAQSATSALNLATTNQASAAAAKTAADTALSSATTARDNALADLNAATAALGTPTTDLATAQADLDAANAALAPFTSTRAAALSSQALAAAAAASAQTAFDNATAAVTAAQTAVTDATNGVSSNTPAFTAGAGADVSVTVTATDTISTLAAKINAANAGVTATVFTDGSNQRLLLASKDTGGAAGFRVQVNDTGDSQNTDNAGLSRLGFDPQSASFGYGSSGITAQYGQDAQVRINGVTATSKTNTFANNVPGVTINVLSTTTTGFGTLGEVRNSATLAVSEDVTPAVKSVNDFITAYNALISNLTDLTKYDAATKTPSAFQGDGAVVGILSVLRSMTGSISNGSVYKRLSDVGIQVQRDGTLSLDTMKLSAAANNGDELKNLFTTDNKNAQTNGFALKFAALAKGVLATGGSVSNKAKALQKELQTNSTEQQRINDRAAMVEARLRKQYSALDAKMAGLSALNAYVAQQVTTWNKSNG